MMVSKKIFLWSNVDVRGSGCEGAGVGHSGTGEVPGHHLGLLQGRRGCHHRVRHHQGGQLQQRRQVGQGRQEQHQQQGHQYHAG